MCVCVCLSTVFRVDLFCSGKVDGEAVLTVQLNLTIHANNYTVLNFKRRKMCYKSKYPANNLTNACLEVHIMKVLQRYRMFFSIRIIIYPPVELSFFFFIADVFICRSSRSTGVINYSNDGCACWLVQTVELSHR